MELSLYVTDRDLGPVALKLERWITPRQFGYYSGDTHIHAAGCSHYESPSEGVTPDVMYRQVKGEALDVGDVLTWGPDYYYQKQFFTGHVRQNESGNGTATLRYDEEVSGFPSSHCGHLVLLRRKEQDYPGATSVDQWPSWNVPILKWAKGQGALAQASTYLNKALRTDPVNYAANFGLLQLFARTGDLRHDLAS